MHSENDKGGDGTKETFTGTDVLYREGAAGFLDVQRAADALLRQGRKPSVAAIREQLGGGSPNTLTPLLARYWEKLGSRLGDGPESLERVPEALARVTELLWMRALQEARERLKLLRTSDEETSGIEALQEQVGKLSIALAEARAREGEQLAHLATLSTERERMRGERASLMALLKSCQALLEQQTSRVAALEGARSKQSSKLSKLSVSSGARHRRTSGNPQRRISKRKARSSVRRSRASKKK
jgi:Plasmid replication region DNA-binding N-term